MYRNPWGHMRVGRLLEDLDSLAGNVAFQHCYTGRGASSGGGSGLPLLVTAAVDEIALTHPLLLARDVVVRGQVVWTGRSALDIRMQLFQGKQLPTRPSQPDTDTVTAQHEPAPSLEALFSFVHLDPATRKASPVVQLAPQTPEQQAAFAERQAVADARKAARQKQGGGDAGVQAALPQETREWIRDARKLQELPALAAADGVLMPATRQHNTFICQPQQRNTHGRVRAYELGFATTYMFGGSRPVFLKARVVVEVEARVTKPEAVESFVTNTFVFVFQLLVQPGGRPLRRVLPTCDEEALRSWRAAGELGGM
eukprot:XP_001690113.1 thioesterase-like protein [Chlamydomonas reinhardtii]